MISFTCTKDVYGNIPGKIFLITNRHYVHIISLKKINEEKYMSGLLSITIDEADLEKKKINSSIILATLITTI